MGLESYSRHTRSVQGVCKNNGVIPKLSRTFKEFSESSDFRESDKSLKHELGSIKDTVSFMCLAGTMVASWSLTQEVIGSSPFTVMTNIFVTEFAEFSENI